LGNQGRQYRQETINWLSATFLGLVLVYGLIASPLIVECIPRDGSSLIELMGQDPCHHPCIHLSHADRSPVALGEYAQEDPCLDLVMDNCGLTQAGLNLQSPLRTVLERLNHSITDAPGILDFSESGNCFRLAREPVAVIDLTPSLTLSLRI
jgi:hypothetical protein